ncbi:cache domain-containing protein [Metapseudomonas furukawaii]|jgi:two-component system NarL family sensor kinase|uniref:cache domain-containing protein n=1 Tax=Metapseudomonas furukawaii TaxID=1149133 RepID=UPI000B4A3FDC|nr:MULTISPECIES: cache domain-containing protein [Pseudomonas]OWJ96484.1 histidine kinase [Pseudomonas sp. A46]WAG76826.1 cache domain-containing protein [Pseudomonas furukawaii]
MQLKYKIVTLSVLPLIASVLIICVLVFAQSRKLEEEQARLVESSIMAAKKAELKNYLELALSLIAPLYQSGRDDEAARQDALRMLSRANFGLDGYFFVYDSHGKNLMHPRQANLVGRELIGMKDKNGLPVIQALLKSAKSGDGFQLYTWEKPSTGQVTDKLSYVVMLDRWGWMLGTGIYIDDVEVATSKSRREVADGVLTTVLAIASVALIAVLVVFSGGLMLNFSEHRLADRKLSALNQRIVRLQEEERSRVSRELHDGISQQLVSIKFQFELAGLELEKGMPRGLENLKAGTARLGEAIGEIRRISHDLRPSLLDTLGLSPAILQLVRDFEQRTGIRTQFEQGLDDTQVGGEVAVTLYRIIQEALGNIERHSRASAAIISLSCSRGGVALRVEDNGVGFDPGLMERSQGIGLRNIRERVDHHRGTFTLSSSSGRTELQVGIPLDA